MRSLPRRLSPCPPLLATALLLAGRVALATDPVGTWAVDTAAMRGEFERLMRADLARMPPTQRAQTEAVLPGRLDEMVHRSAGTAAFRPDGTVLFEGFGGERRTGRWTREGDRIRVLTADEPPYLGAPQGDVMRLDPEGEAEPAPSLVLRRR